MQTSAFLTAYLVTLILCPVLTVAVIMMLNDGMKKFFESISPDPAISGFFSRVTRIVLLLAGLSGAVAANYNTGEKANWLTVTWDSAGLVKDSLEQLFITLIVLSVAFLIMMVIDRKLNR